MESVPPLILGVAIGHSVYPGAGAGVGFGIFFIGLGIAIALAKAPQHTDLGPPKFFAGNAILQKLYYLAFYQVRKNPLHQLSAYHY